MLGSVVALQALKYKLLNNVRPDLVKLVGAGFCQLGTPHSRGPHVVYLVYWAGLALLLIPVTCRLLVMNIGILQTETVCQSDLSVSERANALKPIVVSRTVTPTKRASLLVCAASCAVSMPENIAWACDTSSCVTSCPFKICTTARTC